MGVLLYTLATKLPANTRPPLRSLLANWVNDKKLRTVPQLNAAIEFINKHNSAENPQAGDESKVDERALEVLCGVGVVVDTATIEAVVKVWPLVYQSLIIKFNFVGGVRQTSHFNYTTTTAQAGPWPSLGFYSRTSSYFSSA